MVVAFMRKGDKQMDWQIEFFKLIDWCILKCSGFFENGVKFNLNKLLMRYFYPFLRVPKVTLSYYNKY